MASSSGLSARWQSAPQELVDMVFAKIILTPLQVHATQGTPFTTSRQICAANPEDWDTVKKFLTLSRSTREEGLRLLQLHGALEHIPLAKIDPKIRFSMPIPSHDLLRRFRWIYTGQATLVGGTVSECKLFVNVPGPPRLNHVARVEVLSSIDPRKYTEFTRSALAEHPVRKEAKDAKRTEDAGLMEFLNRVCRAAAWYWVLRPLHGPHLGHTVGTATDGRELIEWKRL